MSVPERCAPARHLYIAMPCYTGHVAADCAYAMARSAVSLTGAGIALTYDILCGSCFVDHVRNLLVARFLESAATDLLFIDADVGFSPEAAMRIAAVQRPFVAGLYPKKNDQETEYPVVFDDRPLWSDAEGLIEARRVPAGFLRLNRAVFAAMPHEDYIERIKEEAAPRRIKGYFPRGIIDGEYCGEDFGFCDIWRKLGGRIYVLPEASFSHTGTKVWMGSWGAWMRARASAEKEDAA